MNIIKELEGNVNKTVYPMVILLYNNSTFLMYLTKTLRESGDEN